MAEWKITPECCIVWPKLWWTMRWMVPADDKTVAMMPYIQSPDNGDKWRVNHCPSCGADVRDCVVSRERLADEAF